MKRWLVFFALLTFLVLPGLASAFTFEFGLNGIAISVMEDRQVLAKAQPDECYYGIGDERNGPIGGGCLPDGIEKTNEAYVWGLAQANGSLWFGIGANVNCLVGGGYFGEGTPDENEDSVCEYGESWIVDALGVPEQIGDWRPPTLYRYDLLFGTLQELEVPEGSVELSTGAPLPIVVVPPSPAPHPNNTLGIRSVGAIDNIVFMGGPSIEGGINLFAFNSLTGAYLGSANLPQYTNVRKWLAVNGNLYVGVGYGELISQFAVDFPKEGRILKWTGSLADPFHFEEVGWTDGSVANISVYGNNRIAVSTWPPGDFSALAGIFISPIIPPGGLTNSHATPGAWKKVWDAGDYEPDPVVAKTYGGGALAYYQGYLYWGTMHVAGASSFILMDQYGYPDQMDQEEFFLNSHRALSIFRGRNFENQFGRAELLYGESILPVYNGESQTFSNTYTGMNPLFGSSGFDALTNTYTWTMQVVGDYLFVGTLDLLPPGDLGGDGSGGGGGGGLDTDALLEFLTANGGTVPINNPGADLWRFEGTADGAIAESFSGAGNEQNYGFRTMLSAGPEIMYVGTANPRNLLDEGGWELIRLERPKNYWLPWFLSWLNIGGN